MPKEFPFLADLAITRLINTFHCLFRDSLNTRLIGGADEPLYLPQGADQPYNAIYFNRDYIASALHEVSHWCVAGSERRKKEDYGYWYAPDGRDAGQQQEFEKVEVKPQAIERILSFACGQPFRISADNLYAGNQINPEFADAIHKQTLWYCENGLSSRAQRLVLALAETFEQSAPLESTNYSREALK
ncbi:MAG: elongation factor P hydroxylase [Agarilytica sp.]